MKLDCSPGRKRPYVCEPIKEALMPADPLDKQLVEAVLSRPRRAKADLEEAKLAGMRSPRGRTAVAVAPDDDEDDDTDLELGPVVGEPDEDGTVSVEVVSEDGTVDAASRLPAEGPTKLDPKEVEEPTAESSWPRPSSSASSSSRSRGRASSRSISGPSMTPSARRGQPSRSTVCHTARRHMPSCGRQSRTKRPRTFSFPPPTST
jgi:hypothetical protein